MIDKEFTCIVCPKGCQLHVFEDEAGLLQVQGHSCKRGESYGKQEVTDPRRNISSTVRVHHGFLKLVPVKTASEIPKDKIFEVMEAINHVEVEAPVSLGQVIISNVASTGADIVATRDIARVE